MKEYLDRVKKIWQSEHSSSNKVIAHNTFAISVFTNTVGIIDWTIEEIKEMDAGTRKQLTTTGKFHPNGDVDKLYLPISQGSRDIKMIARMFESRVTAVAQCLTINSNRSNICQIKSSHKSVCI